MSGTEILWLEAALFLIAMLYSATGHGGGSGYIAVMVLFGMAPAEIKPLALGLNVVVAAVGTVLFYRAGHFRWPLFWPFVLGSVPLALVGGYWQLPMHWFNLLLGCVLIFSALRLVLKPLAGSRELNLSFALLAGAVIGLISGLLGIGGGILLTPLLLLAGWANPKQAAAVSAPFILLNSLSALAGFSAQAALLPQQNFYALAGVVLLGGLCGAYFGSRSLPMTAIARVLSAVLIIAGCKLFYV